MSRRPRPYAAAAVLLLATAALSACTGGEPDGPRTLSPLPSVTSTSASPSATASASPTPTSTAGLSDEDQVRGVYEALFIHLESADRFKRASKRRAYLAQWAVDPALAAYVDGAKVRRHRHQELVGRRVTHVVGVTVRDTQGRVTDCADESRLVLKDDRTGDVISRGAKHLRLFAKLKKTPDGWRVWSSTAKEGACVPGAD